MKNTKNILFGTILGLFFTFGILGCSKWTQPEAEDFYEPPTEAYTDNMKDYFSSPHKVMFGWFGNWAGEGGSMQYSLMGLPDSIDFVSLWLCWGNLTEAQQKDLKNFQARGSKAVLCWRAGNIGANLTPAVEILEDGTVVEHPQTHSDESWRKKFWGIPKVEVYDIESPDYPAYIDSLVAAAEKYAMAIVDTCRKYDIDGFDYDIEDWGDLMSASHPEVPNAFMRKLYAEFQKDGRMLVADIPGGLGWLDFYDVLENDVLESLEYLVWQTYDLTGSGLDNFFYTSSYGVKAHNPEMFECVMRKSIVTATFEEATKKYRFLEQCKWTPSFGIEPAGYGAYHIEYDYPGNPDYGTVREGISLLNPPILK